MNKIKKEAIYLISTMCMVLLISILLFGVDNLKEDDLVLNVHSTYFVINKFQYFIFSTPILLAIMYIVRILIQRFKNPISNLLFTIFNGLLAVMLLFILLLNNEDGFEVNYKLWILLLILLAIEVYVIKKLLKKGTRT